MRLPYLQVTQETWWKARMLGALLAVDRFRAFAMICDLWAWALEQGPADAPPTGRLESPRAARILAGALEWSGDPEALVEALQEVGLIDYDGHAIRVRGMGRYEAAWRSPEAKKDQARNAANARWHPARAPKAGCSSNPGACGEHRENGAGACPDADAEADVEKEKPPPYPPPRLQAVELHEPEAPTEEVQACWGAMQRRRERLDLSPEDMPRKFKSWLYRALKQGYQPGELADGHARFLEDPDFRKKGWPTAVFISDSIWPQRSRVPPPRQEYG